MSFFDPVFKFFGSKPATPAAPSTATAPKLPGVMNADLLNAGARKRRRTHRGGFAEQGVNSSKPLAPTGAAGTLGGRRHTRKHKSKGKKHTRRH
jgi:hypothetical protein